MAHAGKWIYQNAFITDTTIAPQEFMFLSADVAGNLYASCYNSSATTENVNFYKITNWINGTPTFLAFDTTTGVPSGRSQYGMWVDANGNVYGSADLGVAASSFYKVWNSSLVAVTTVLDPSSGRPTGIAVDEDTTNANGLHLYQGDLVNGKIRVRTQLNQAIAGGSPYTQMVPGTYPRGLTIQPIQGNSTSYNLWINQNGSAVEYQNICGRAIEADVSDTLAYSLITIAANPQSDIINDLGIAYDSVENTIIFSGGNDQSNPTTSWGQTMQIINASSPYNVIQVLGTPSTVGNDSVHFNSPAGATTVGSGTTHYLAVTDCGNYRIVVYRYGFNVTPSKTIIQPNGTFIVTADTTAAIGTINWTLSTTSLVVASLSTTQGASITVNIGGSSGAGNINVTATDGNGDTGYSGTILVSPTSAPLATESDSIIIQSKPVWTFME
jgi:hypothetical protein